MDRLINTMATLPSMSNGRLALQFSTVNGQAEIALLWYAWVRGFTHVDNNQVMDRNIFNSSANLICTWICVSCYGVVYKFDCYLNLCIPLQCFFTRSHNHSANIFFFCYSMQWFYHSSNLDLCFWRGCTLIYNNIENE